MELILGDNPFFGVNHRSQKKAAQYLEKKGDFSNASNVVKVAHNLGVGRMMASNHEDLPLLLDKIYLEIPGALQNLRIALVVPYAQKFNQIVASAGMLGLAADLPYVKSAMGASKLLWSALFSKKVDIETFIEILFDAELSSLGNHIDSVDMLCLHNIVTDLCIGLKKPEFIQQFCAACESKGRRPVIITQNPILLDSILPRSAILCFSYNKRGFMVSPSVDEVREKLSFKRDYWAMAILASGALTIDDALDDKFLKKFSGILYATGSKSRAANTIPKIIESI